METYYQGLKARKHLRKIGFKGRGNGSGKEGSATPNKKNGTCRDCGQKGHWKGDPECPKAKKTGEPKPSAEKGEAPV